MSVQFLKQTHVIPTPYVLIQRDLISVDALVDLMAMAKTAQVSYQIRGGFLFLRKVILESLIYYVDPLKCRWCNDPFFNIVLNQ